MTKIETNRKALKGPSITVRMYRQGLGDCFLVTFGEGTEARNMLIDCGSLGNHTTEVGFDQIAQDLRETVGSTGKLDFVVATHEHKDHLCGFRKALKDFVGKVEHVWLAWTEDPSDAVTQQLVKDRRDLGEALTSISRVEDAAAIQEQLLDVLAFSGDLSATAFAETVQADMEFVRTKLGAQVSYFKPGNVINELIPGFRVFILGPPRDAKSLGLLGEHGSAELYGIQRAAAFHAVADDIDDHSRDTLLQFEPDQPFDNRHTRRGDSIVDRYPEYCDEENSWRGIETDWLNVASELALQLDSITNNTSLAFAIERISDGRVLLFPADAQLGNWKSWHDPNLKFIDERGHGIDVTAKDLLERTVFYKVGHHASHNATARGDGLELMRQQQELTAFIPVDRAIALTRNPRGSWQMPAPLLYRQLLEKCQGRVARSDLGWASCPKAEQATEIAFIDLATPANWREWKKSQDAATHVRITELFVEYKLRETEV
jgi:hypothetical protein